MDNKTFFIRVGVIAALILLLYFVFSPYQNCLRALPYPAERVRQIAWCGEKTSW